MGRRMRNLWGLELPECTFHPLDVLLSQRLARILMMETFGQLLNLTSMTIYTFDSFMLIYWIQCVFLWNLLCYKSRCVHIYMETIQAYHGHLKTSFWIFSFSFQSMFKKQNRSFRSSDCSGCFGRVLCIGSLICSRCWIRWLWWIPTDIC